jgi:predicted methyltransferase
MGENPEYRMRSFHSFLLFTALTLSGMQPVIAGSAGDISKSLANPARSAADRERDARDKPRDVLELAGFKKGMVIADVFGGGGYYSEILSRVVGPKGRVLLLNNAPYDNYAKKEIGPRFADGRLPNVAYKVVPNDALGLAENSLDGALIVMSYHDLFYADPENGWPAIDSRQFMGQIVAGLKPGGRLLIVDHSAKDGTGASDAQKLHRIEEQYALAQLKSYGLDWVGSIAVLRNTDDDRSLGVFDPAIKGKTDRFVHVYQKPGR